MKSKRTLFSEQVLINIGFTVILVQHIPHTDNVISNKISMQSIYKRIAEGNEEYAYVFEDDINILEPIQIEEIIEYEKISDMFFYLGLCKYSQHNGFFLSNNYIRNKIVGVVSGCVRGLHAIGLSKKGAKELLKFSEISENRYMDMILEEFTLRYPANIVRYDLESYIHGHRGIIFQDRNRFPSEI